MIDDLIPNFSRELEDLNAVASAGWTIGFNYRWTGPEHLFTGFPQAWRDEYEGNNYAIGDPVLLWMMSKNSGHIRWSAIRTPDMRGVMEKARRQNINYGVAYTRRVGLKKSFLSIARADREFTDEEILTYDAKFNVWVDLLLNRAALTEGELQVLSCFRNGLGQTETAETLGVSAATVKQRFMKACAKLNASTRTQAVAIAVARNYI